MLRVRLGRLISIGKRLEFVELGITIDRATLQDRAGTIHQGNCCQVITERSSLDGKQ